MKIEGAHDIPAPRQKVWEAFLDPERLRQAIPGCEKLEALGNDEFRAVMKIGVAAIKGTFEGKVRLADQKAPEDRKSTRLNSSHSQISYAVFCLKKKKKEYTRHYVLNYLCTQAVEHVQKN